MRSEEIARKSMAPFAGNFKLTSNMDKQDRAKWLFSGRFKIVFALHRIDNTLMLNAKKCNVNIKSVSFPTNAAAMNTSRCCYCLTITHYCGWRNYLDVIQFYYYFLEFLGSFKHNQSLMVFKDYATSRSICDSSRNTGSASFLPIVSTGSTACWLSKQYNKG